MAGVKGKSGGPRANAGGARPNAGRPRKPKPEPVVIATPKDDADMLELLKSIALGHIDATQIQVRAAIAAVQYTHTKKADGGKKEEKARLAEVAEVGFLSTAPPKLVANGGRKL